VKARRRLIKTEIELPGAGPGRVLVVLALVVGGAVAMAMATLFGLFVVETLRGVARGGR